MIEDCNAVLKKLIRHGGNLLEGTRNSTRISINWVNVLCSYEYIRKINK